MEENEMDFNEKTTLRKKHWYISIPFTKKRLIFEGFRYEGWYIYK